MNQNGESPNRIPRGIVTHCPQCGTQVVPESVIVGWSEGATYDTPLGSTVWITCKTCAKQLKSGNPTSTPQSMDDALRKLEEG